MQIKKPDFEFTLNILEVDKSSEVDYVEINQIFLKMA
jgi:hypothetical protein